MKYKHELLKCIHKHLLLSLWTNISLLILSLLLTHCKFTCKCVMFLYNICQSIIGLSDFEKEWLINM